MNRVLLVSDNEEVMDRATAMLEPLGWEVNSTRSRDAAILICHARETRVAIVDIEMPGGDGLETISRIRRIDEKILILAVTRGRDDKDLERVATVCGADRYVVGPISHSKIITAIGAGLDSRRATSELD